MSAVVLATAGYDHKIRFWEASREKCTRVLKYPESQVNALAITNDKQYIAAVGNPHAKIFEVHHGEGSPIRSYDAHGGNVTCVGFQCDAKWMYTASEDKTIKIWDLRAPRWQRQYECPAGVNSVALHPNQRDLVSGDQAGHLRIWDLQANACSQELTPADYDFLDPTPGTGESTGSMGGSIDDELAAGQASGQASSRPLPRHAGDAGARAIRSVSMASDGSLIAAASHSGRIFTWRPTAAGNGGTGYVRFAAIDSGHHGYLTKCVLSPDVSRLITCSSDKTVRVWSLPGGATRPSFQLEKTLAQHTRWVWDACFSADSAYLVTASSDWTARLWDVHTGEAIRHYAAPMAVTCVALNDASG